MAGELHSPPRTVHQSTTACCAQPCSLHRHQKLTQHWAFVVQIAGSLTASTCAGVKWLGDFTAPMKLAPAWDQMLAWAAACREKARASHDFTCEVSGAEAPYVWDHDGPAVKLMAQFARPMVAGVC